MKIKKERTDECIAKILYARDGYDRGVTAGPQETLGIFFQYCKYCYII